MALVYRRVSTTASGGQANSDSYSATISPDGGSIAFYSFADNLIAGDTNATFDIFLKTLATGAVTRLSTSAAGVQGNGVSSVPVFSPDGTRVAFTSSATNLVAGDTNGASDIFVKTISTGAIARVSTDAAGSQANGASSQVIFSPDGTKVAFISAATNLVAGDTNTFPDLFVKDLGTGAVTRIQLNYGASGAGTGSFTFAPDGGHIAVSSSGALILVDLATGASTRLSTRGSGAAADDGNSSHPAFSADGTKLVFDSDAALLAAGDTNRSQDVFVKDLTTGAVTRVSTSATGAQADSASQSAQFSPDGTQVVFLTSSGNLVAGTVAGTQAIVVKDLITGVVTLVAELTGQFMFDGGPQFTPDGKSIVFSTPTPLLAGDGNGAFDVYLATLPAPPAGAITFTSGATATTLENTSTATVVYTAQATDSVAGQALTYILSGGPDAGLFDIDATTGAVTFKTSPNFEAPIDGGHGNLYRVIVTATDGVRTTGRPVTISVTDVNDNAPVFNSATVATVASGLAAGATAYTAHAVDADRADAVTYSLAGGADAAKVDISAATGAVSFKTAPSYAVPDDAGADHVYDITVRASDGVAAHDALSAVRITVADPAAAPVAGTPTPVASVSLVSTNAAGVQGDAFSGVLGSSDAALSADGTRIAFVSWSDNLVAGDTNAISDVFVKTLSTGAIVRASTDSSGGQITSFAQGPAFSPDGARLLFTSTGAVFSGSFQGDLAMKDLVTGTLTLVSSDAAATLGVPGAISGSFSADGARVIFSAGSYAAGNGSQSLVAGDTNLTGDIYIKTLATGAVIRVSDSAAGEIGDGLSLTPVFSPDGTKAAFATDAANLFPGDANGHRDVVLKDLATGVVTQLSVNADGVGGNGDSTTPVFSPDGRSVAFISKASNLVAGDTNGAMDVFVKNLSTGVVTRVSTGNAGQQGDGDSYRPIFSADGTKLLFTSAAANFSSRDGNGAADVFVKDLATGGLSLVSVDATGASGNGASLGDAISADGVAILFSSDATNLAAGDANGVSDVFLARLGFPSTTGAVTFTSAPAATIAENPGLAAVAYTAHATDSDPSRVLTYSLSGGADAALFTINGFSGAVSFKSAPDFELPADAGANNVYDIVVTATETNLAFAGGPSGDAAPVFANASIAVAISVTDVNDNAPVFTSGGTATAASGAPLTTVAYTAHAVDADVADTIGYSLSGGADAAKFNIDAASGAVTFKTVPSYAAPDDAGADHVYDIVVKASDGLVSHDVTKAVAITVTALAPPPVTPPSPPPVADNGLLTEFYNLARAGPASPEFAQTGSVLATALQSAKAISTQYDSGQISLVQAETALVRMMDGTASVAVVDYAFFTGRTPTLAGLSYLVHSSANATDLNDPYYAKFSTENRYINFAVNLGTGAGAGAAVFSAAYGALSLAQAVGKAYAAIFGAPADAAKVDALLNTLVPNGLGGTETRAAYFAEYGGDGPNGLGTKAAAAGFLLADSVKEQLGVYGPADAHYLQALAHGAVSPFDSELALTYGAAAPIVGVPLPDPTLGV